MTVVVNLRFSKKEVKLMDEAIKKYGYLSRSEFIREAVRKHLIVLLRTSPQRRRFTKLPVG